MSSHIVNRVKMSKENTKLVVIYNPIETTCICIYDSNLIHIIVFNLSSVHSFIRAFWRSIPPNNIIMTCISYNTRRKAKSLARGDTTNQFHYISVVSPSPQLTSSSSSPSPDTTSSIVSSNSSQTNTLTTIKMTPNETVVHTQPSAPSPGLVLFNSEEQSDIVFLVGNEPDPVWRFPAHSFIVENASPVFKAMVENGRNGRNNEELLNKRITWCKPEIFHIILRHMYTNEITITSVSNALVVFTAANQFLLNELTRICLTFLYENCSHENVLEMISHFSQFSYLRLSSTTRESNVSNDSSEGPVSRQSSHQYSNNCDNILNELITRCYHTLDSEANKILCSEAFTSLDHDLVVKILSRDTLKVSSELDVFECIMHWSCQQCKRQCKQLTSDNKRDVLGKALYCPRYLAMTVDEFLRGPYVCDVLNDQEKCLLLARLRGDDQVVLPVHLLGRKLDMARKFVDQVNSGVGELASTSNGTNSSGNAGIIVKKKSTSKKLLNGLGDLVICVIRLLD